MADSEIPKSPNPPKKDLPVEQRMLLAFVLMGIVLFATQFFYKPQPQDTIKPVKPASTQQAKAPTPAPEAKADAASPSAAQVTAAPKEESFVVDTDLYRIEFSNRGAVVRSWQLKQYREGGTGQPLQLVNLLGIGKAGYPFSLAYEGQKPSVDLDQALFVTRPAADKLGVEFEFSNGRTVARKTFRFAKNSYLAQVTSEVLENNAGIPHLLAWRGGFGDHTVAATTATQRSIVFDQSQNKLIQNEAKVAKDGPQTAAGNYAFAGLEDSFFAAVVLPKDGQSTKLQTLSDNVIDKKDGKEEAHVGAAVGGDAKNVLSMFVGPKDVDLLKKVDPKLSQIVDFGWFSFIAKPLFTVVNWLHDTYIHNYGWTIILVTIAINFLLLPLKFTSMRSMKRMAALQPQIQAINDKYRDVSIRDPQKADQNAEVMALYKKHGVNPMGGCIPLVLQIPFFFAFYKVLSVAIELRGANWLWVQDLSQLDPLYVLPVTMVATQFLVQKMTPSTTTDPAQQKMMLFMPLMLGFLFMKASSGLVLYWLTGNVVSLAQQWFMNRSGGTATPAAATVLPTKPVGKKNSGRR